MPNDPFYRGAAWRILRGEVIRKAGGCCQECGERAVGRNAHVDHIKSRRAHPELAYNIDNLRLLCVKCHMRKGCREDGVLGHKPRGPYVGGCAADGDPTSPGHPWNADSDD